MDLSMATAIGETADGLKVTVPAGSFDCYRVEISPTDGGARSYRAWTATDSRKPVKFTVNLPQTGGAILTAELQ
jgi:hypothetical protein